MDQVERHGTAHSRCRRNLVTRALVVAACVGIVTYIFFDRGASSTTGDSISPGLPPNPRSYRYPTAGRLRATTPVLTAEAPTAAAALPCDEAQEREAMEELLSIVARVPVGHPWPHAYFSLTAIIEELENWYAASGKSCRPEEIIKAFWALEGREQKVFLLLALGAASDDEFVPLFEQLLNPSQQDQLLAAAALFALVMTKRDEWSRTDWRRARAFAGALVELSVAAGVDLSEMYRELLPKPPPPSLWPRVVKPFEVVSSIPAVGNALTTKSRLSEARFALFRNVLLFDAKESMSARCGFICFDHDEWFDDTRVADLFAEAITATTNGQERAYWGSMCEGYKSDKLFATLTTLLNQETDTAIVDSAAMSLARSFKEVALPVLRAAFDSASSTDKQIPIIYAVYWAPLDEETFVWAAGVYSRHVSEEVRRLALDILGEARLDHPLVQQTLLDTVRDTEDIQLRALELLELRRWRAGPQELLSKSVELFSERSEFPSVRQAAERLLTGRE